MLRLYDTMARRKRRFASIRKEFVGIYTCGPSVYSYSHIGNFRTYLFEDVLVRYLRYRGYRVLRVMNITDVEDKAVEAARKEGSGIAELAKSRSAAFFSDFDALLMARPDVVAKASEHVPEMLALIGRICAAGYCRFEPDGVYFDVRRFGGYGRLRRLKGRRYLGKAAGDDYAREGLSDFRLWKRWTRGDGATGWEGRYGFGRPGWHIECSAMAMRYLGERFDIHCGGSDNIFPHHENEIAQSAAATGKVPARYWLHSRHLTLRKRKMSKRTGNVLYVGALLKGGIHPECLRYYLLSASYRKPLDFDLKAFHRRVCACEMAGKTIASLRRLAKEADGPGGAGPEPCLLIKEFERAMDDDLDTGKAFDSVFRFFARVEKSLRAGEMSPNRAAGILEALGRVDSVLGVFGISRMGGRGRRNVLKLGRTKTFHRCSL